MVENNEKHLLVKWNSENLNEVLSKAEIPDTIKEAYRGDCIYVKKGNSQKLFDWFLCRSQANMVARKYR